MMSIDQGLFPVSSYYTPVCIIRSRKPRSVSRIRLCFALMIQASGRVRTCLAEGKLEEKAEKRGKQDGLKLICSR
jgi:hypothetical protein